MGLGVGGGQPRRGGALCPGQPRRLPSLRGSRAGRRAAAVLRAAAPVASRRLPRPSEQFGSVALWRLSCPRAVLKNVTRTREDCAAILIWKLEENTQRFYFKKGKNAEKDVCSAQRRCWD